MPMKRVLVAWADETSTNLGIRALHEGTVALIRSADPHTQVESQCFRQGTAPINIGSPRSLLREFVLDSRRGRTWMRQFDLVVDTRQGDSFADIYGLPRLRQHSSFAEFATRCGVPVVLGPQTIGPFTTRSGRAIARRTLRRARLVMARDSRSAEAAERLGRPADLTSTDVVFALPRPTPGAQYDVLFNVSGLLWNGDDHGSRDHYRRTVSGLLAELKERGRTVTLLAHVIGTTGIDCDVPTVQQLGNELGLPVIVPGSLTHARTIMAGANLLIGSRMHACLNALSVGTPAVALAYSRKFAPLLGDLGWPGVVELGEPSAAGRLVEWIEADELNRQAVERVLVRAEALLGRARAGLREIL